MDAISLLDISPLELIAGFGYLLGHAFLSFEKITGWLFKIIGGIAWIVFLFLNANYIFMAVTISVVAAMFYGVYKWRKGTKGKLTTIDKTFEWVSIAVAIAAIAAIIISQTYTWAAGLETVIVIAEISGTVLLARKRVLGWLILTGMSVCVGILVIFVNPVSAIILGILELLSIIFYMIGIRRMKSASGTLLPST